MNRSELGVQQTWIRIAFVVTFCISVLVSAYPDPFPFWLKFGTFLVVVYPLWALCLGQVWVALGLGPIPNWPLLRLNVSTFFYPAAFFALFIFFAGGRMLVVWLGAPGD